jgi:hypothetical protein
MLVDQKWGGMGWEGVVAICHILRLIHFTVPTLIWKGEKVGQRSNLDFFTASGRFCILSFFAHMGWVVLHLFLVFEAKVTQHPTP